MSSSGIRSDILKLLDLRDALLEKRETMFDAFEKVMEEDNAGELARLTELLGKTQEEYATHTTRLKAMDLKDVLEKVRSQEERWQKDIRRQERSLHKMKRKTEALAKLLKQAVKTEKIRNAYGAEKDESSILSSQG